MPEARSPTAPEFKLGDPVPILEHHCIAATRAHLGLNGEITKLDPSGIPLLAKCEDCGQDKTVDLITLRAQGNK